MLMADTAIQVDEPEVLFDPDDAAPMESRKTVCIYKTPTRLKRANPEYFAPRALLIGPFQYSRRTQALEMLRQSSDQSQKSMEQKNWKSTEEELVTSRYNAYLKMEDQKEIYGQAFKNRFGEKIVEQCKRHIEMTLEDIKARYADLKHSISTGEFVDLILRDAVFLIEIVFRKSYEGLRFQKRYSQGLNPSEMRNLADKIYEDLILLENQLPFDLLEHLYDKITSKRFLDLGATTFREMTLKFFGLRCKQRFEHFTDLFRLARTKSLKSARPTSERTRKYLPNAETLRESDIDFELARDKDDASIRVSYESRSRKLRMGRLNVDHNTGQILKNIAALEHCHYRSEMYVSSYLQLLTSLVDTENDVKILAEKGIIKSSIGYHHGVLVDMVNKLGQGLEDQLDYFNVETNLIRDYKNGWNRAVGTLKGVYFANVWAGTATVAGIVALVLTVTQTATSIMQILPQR